MAKSIVSIATALLAIAATACGSSADSNGSIPGIEAQGISVDSFSCIGSKPARSTSLSRALASTCGCDPHAVHVDGTPSNVDAVDCSGATVDCVNGVLDSNGFRDPPWSATTTSFPPCSSLAVTFDPCAGGCVEGPTADGGTTGGDDDGDDDDGDGNHGHHHHHGH